MDLHLITTGGFFSLQFTYHSPAFCPKHHLRYFQRSTPPKQVKPSMNFFWLLKFVYFIRSHSSGSQQYTLVSERRKYRKLNNRQLAQYTENRFSLLCFCSFCIVIFISARSALWISASLRLSSDNVEEKNTRKPSFGCSMHVCVFK